LNGASRKEFLSCVSRSPPALRPMASFVIGNARPDGPATAPHAAAAVTLIDTERNAVASHVRLPDGSIDVRAIAISPDNHYAFATHVLGRTHASATQLDEGWLTTNAISIIDLQKRTLLTTVLLDRIRHGAGNPWGAACSSDGRKLWVALAGVHEMAVIDLPPLLEKLHSLSAPSGSRGNPANGYSAQGRPDTDLTFLPPYLRRIPLGGQGPRAVALLGGRAYVGLYFSGDIEALDVEKPGGPRLRISLGPEPAETEARRGERLFHDASLSFQGWQSCSTCHFDGRSDGVNWDLTNDGIANAKNTKSLVYSYVTPPLTWTGIFPALEDCVPFELRTILFASGPKTDATAIVAYLKSLEPAPSIYPDGTHDAALYGPERRQFWSEVDLKYAFWDMPTGYYSTGIGGIGDNRNRVLKLSQSQGLPDGRVVAVSSAGLFTFGPGMQQERLVPHDRKYAVTTPFPIGGNKVVAAASIKQFKIGGKVMDAGSPELLKVRAAANYRDNLQDAVNMDLELYIVDPESGEMKLLYNDPNFAEFEPRPIIARTPPPVVPDTINGSEAYTAKLFAASVFQSRFDRVRDRGKLIRVVEGQPFVSRNETHANVQQSTSNRYANHGGTMARVLGTFPLAADGSFYVEVPADRLVHLQVLDSDRRVMGNQTFWMYARPGETRGCVGCHEPSDVSVPAKGDVMALKTSAFRALPQGNEFTYRAKTWLRGGLSDEAEERTRTVQAVSLIARQ
jgi:Hydrazine synthase alpha subunit middle domain/Di-haem cytochrome c peroxidase